MPTMHNAHHYTRSSPPHVRKTAAKAARSAPASKAVVTPKVTVRAAKAVKKANEEEEEAFDTDEDDMGSSFLQFCAMCEKQIVVPNSSILYCSESCRRHDAASPPTAHPYLCLLNSPTDMSPPTLNEDLDDPTSPKLPTHVPRLQPTPRTAPDGRIPAKFHEGKSDLDPTEWKPADASPVEGKSPTKSSEWRPKMAHRPSSEATSYLSQFHRSSDSITSKRRPLIGRSRTTVSSRSTPALSFTPAASTSSDQSLAGTPYEFVAPPALSTQAASSAKASVVGSDDFTYEKKQVGVSMGSASGSLKRLLGTAEVAI